MAYFFYEDEIEKILVEEGKFERKIKARGGDMMMAEVYCKGGAIGYSHKHPHEQACYCLEGEFEFDIAGEVKVIKEGDSVFVPGNVEHGLKLLSETGRLLDVFTPQRLDFLN